MHPSYTPWVQRAWLPRRVPLPLLLSTRPTFNPYIREAGPHARAHEVCLSLVLCLPSLILAHRWPMSFRIHCKSESLICHQLPFVPC